MNNDDSVLGVMVSMESPVTTLMANVLGAAERLLYALKARLVQ